MSEKTYNGWTNYETWCTSLWLDNDQGTYNEVRDMVREALGDAPQDEEGDDLPYTDEQKTDARIALRDSLSEYCQAMLPEVEGFAADLLSSAFSEVDFREIAQSLIDEVCE